MRIFPKRHFFAWDEPKLSLPLRSQNEKNQLLWWHKPVAAILVFSLLLLGRFVSQFDPTKHPPSWTVFSFIALTLAIITYWSDLFEARISYHIEVFEQKVVRYRAHAQVIRFDALVSFSWHRETEFSALLLQPRRGQKILIGVPKDFPVEALHAFLLERVTYDAASWVAEPHQASA